MVLAIRGISHNDIVKIIDEVDSSSELDSRIQMTVLGSIHQYCYREKMYLLEVQQLRGTLEAFHSHAYLTDSGIARPVEAWIELNGRQIYPEGGWQETSTMCCVSANRAEISYDHRSDGEVCHDGLILDLVSIQSVKKAMLLILLEKMSSGSARLVVEYQDGDVLLPFKKFLTEEASRKRPLSQEGSTGFIGVFGKDSSNPAESGTRHGEVCYRLRYDGPITD
jgi:hypothetical protein